MIGEITTDITRTANRRLESQHWCVYRRQPVGRDIERYGFGEAVVAFMNPGGIRADLTFSLPAAPELDGEVTYGEAVSARSRSATASITMTLTGAQIDTLLEQQWVGQTKRADSAGVRRDSATTWTLCGRPTAAKVDPATITVGGVAVDPAADYRITVNSFLAAGGDNFAVLVDGTDRLGGEIDVDAFVTYFGDNTPIAPGPQDRITRIN